MPHELEYVVDKAVCFCDKGAKPDFFSGTNNTHIKINGCKACTKADKQPLVNIPSFGVCSVTGSPCAPAPIDWNDTYKVKVKGEETLLFKSALPCAVGGKVAFMTSGQVPVSQADLDELMGEHGEEEEEGWGWWDTAELIPVVGSVIGIVRSAAKGDGWMAAANVGFLVMDVAGLISFGATTAVSTGLKTTAKVGTKVATRSAIKSGAKKAGTKILSKEAIKTAGKALAKKVDDIAMATGKVCVFACFPAGTVVHTAEGLKNIEEILVGDQVWSFDEESGEIALQDVTATMTREVDATVLIELEGEIVETTAEHPFFTQEGWKDAADLSISDTIQTKSGEHKKVLNLDFSYLRKKVFNFEVAGWHTYFVGILAWLVHNAKVCITEVIKKISNRLKYMGRTPGKNSRTGREVIERMAKEGKIRTKKGVKQFKDSKGKWHDMKYADMSHKKDAVTWWNEIGRKYGAKSKKVRDWMLNSDNYYLDHKSINRSQGAKIQEVYKIPLK